MEETDQIQVGQVLLEQRAMKSMATAGFEPFGQAYMRSPVHGTSGASHQSRIVGQLLNEAVLGQLDRWKDF